jgi:hypothetical protein
LYQIVEADVDTSTGEVHRWHDRYRLLQKYSGDPSVFVHFSDVNKLGINPSSNFSTPIGVYGYPVDYVIESLGGLYGPMGYKESGYESQKYGSFDVPFAGNRQYAHVFRVRDLDRCLIVGEQVWEERSSSGNDFVGGVVDFIDRFFDPKRVRDSISNLVVGSERIPKSVFLDYPFLNYDIYNLHNYILSNDINVPPGLPEFPGEEVIARRVGGDLGRVKLAAICAVKRYGVDKIVHYNSGDIKLLWCFTMSAARIGSRSAIRANSTTFWSRIMRDLGISGIIDNGSGIIHHNEPTQAVFFDVRDLVHLDVVRNIYSSDRELRTITDLARDGDFTYIYDFYNLVDAAVKDIEDSFSDVNKIANTPEWYAWPIIEPWEGVLRGVFDLNQMFGRYFRKLAVYVNNGGDKYIKEKPRIVQTVYGCIDLAYRCFYMKKLFDEHEPRTDRERKLIIRIKEEIDKLDRIFGKLGKLVR